MAFSIGPEGLDDPGVMQLFEAADAYGLSIYPPENYHALDVSEFRRDDVTLLVARSDTGDALGMAALVEQADGYGELKRMFVDEAGRGQGVGSALLGEIETTAKALGIRNLRLETGEPQTAALALYARAGYLRCAPFGEYVDDPTSVCMEKVLG
jgi:putative acetyltransferase